MALHFNVDFSTTNRLSNLRKKIKRYSKKSPSLKVEILGKIYKHKNVNELHILVYDAPTEKVDEFIRHLPIAPTQIVRESEKFGASPAVKRADGAQIIYAL